MSESINIYNFICSLHTRGRNGYTNDGFTHYMNILIIIKEKMFNPDKPESNFVTLCVEEKWDHARSVADTRNKEAFELNLFPKFVESVKKSPEYIEFSRDRKINQII